jgi:hypothetical protein
VHADCTVHVASDFSLPGLQVMLCVALEVINYINTTRNVTSWQPLWGILIGCLWLLVGDVGLGGCVVFDLPTNCPYHMKVKPHRNGRQGLKSIEIVDGLLPKLWQSSESILRGLKEGSRDVSREQRQPDLSDPCEPDLENNIIHFNERD